MKILLIIVAMCASQFYLNAQTYEAELKPEGIVFPSMFESERNNLTNLADGQCIFNMSTNSLDCYTNRSGIDQWFSVQAMGEIDEDNRNTIYGYRTKKNRSGNQNTIIGYSAEYQGDNNVVIGFKAGDDGSGSNNVYLGSGAGISNIGSNNIFIGLFAGDDVGMDNTLIIEGGGSSQYPLLYGDFDKNDLTINGTVNISEIIKLEPLNTADAPMCNATSLGSVYMDRPTDKLMLCNSTGWKAIQLEP